MVAHAFNLSTQEAQAGRYCEFKAVLVYIVSSRTARATQRNLVLKIESNSGEACIARILHSKQSN